MDDFSRPAPWDEAAERAVLGAMLTSAAAVETCVQSLAGDDFYQGAHNVVFEAIVAMRRKGMPVDVVTVKDYLESVGKIGLMGGPLYLHTLMASVPAAVNAGHYARIVRERAVRRRLIEVGTRIVQIGYEADEEAYGLTERALREVEGVRDSGLESVLSTQTITEFLDVPEEEDYDWIIDGLLERQDRVILTGSEGAGKSTLFRQFATMCAAGLHPFTCKPITPIRVLLIDRENGTPHVRRKLRPLVKLAGDLLSEANLWVEAIPDTMDLARDRDLSRLLRQVDSIRPDLVCVGPLYRLAPRALNDDSDAAPILAALDMIRSRGAAVLLEAHAGHGQGAGGRDLRPRGSSAFMGWPEFGLGLRPSGDPLGQATSLRVVDIVHWRGDRDERPWPTMLTEGQDWPWQGA